MPVGTELRRMRGHPGGGREGRVDTGRELVLGRQRIGHRDHDRLRRHGERAREAVVRVEVAEHEAAAVEEHDDRQHLLRRRVVDAHVERPHRGVDAPVGDRGHRRAGWQRREHAAHALSDRVGRERVHVGEAGGGEAIQMRLGLGMKRHVLSSGGEGDSQSTT